MNTCLNCEVVRARFIAVTMRLMGSCEGEIVAELHKKYGPSYYANGTEILRSWPHVPHEPKLILKGR